MRRVRDESSTISSNTLPASPSGPAYIAEPYARLGTAYTFMSACFPRILTGELAAKLNSFQPEVVGVSIRLAFGDELDLNALLGTRHNCAPRVKEIVGK